MGKMIMNGVSYGINANSTIYGAFIDTTNILKPRTAYAGSFSYTATQDCAVVVEVANATSNSASIFIDGALVGSIYGGNSVNQLTDTYYIKRGQTISGTTGVSGAEVGYTVYGLLYNAGETTNTVIPNPQAVPRDTLDSISIGGMVYDVGSKYGAFIDTNRVLYSQDGISNVDYTAVEDCYVMLNLESKNTGSGWAYIDGELVGRIYGTQGETLGTVGIYLKKGQRVTTTNTGTIGQYIRVYGLTFGTNNIFTPQIYSLEEREIGTWIDNKPLYCKTIEIPSFPSSTAAMNKPHNISNIDTITHYEAHVRFASSGSVVVIPNAQLNNGSFIAGASFDCTVNKTNITIRTGMDRSSLSGDITIWYTKTTDVPGSGSYNTLGVPMVHYSTEEQVVGTWIDGKPLYSKTIVFSGISGNNTTFDMDTLNCDKCIKTSGLIKLGTGGGNQWVSAPFLENGNYMAYAKWQENDNILAVVSSWGLTDAVITVQYTKTTD